jgi:hypothetical protein
MSQLYLRAIDNQIVIMMGLIIWGRKEARHFALPNDYLPGKELEISAFSYPTGHYKTC